MDEEEYAYVTGWVIFICVLAFLAGIATGMILAGTILTAHAEDMPDFCNKPLDPRTDPGALIDWRMRCTIQKLVAERAEEADKATQIEVNLAVSDAHLKVSHEMLEAANKEAVKRADYWKKYMDGLRISPKLISAIDKACEWRGTQNAPTAKMCRIWRQAE